MTLDISGTIHASPTVYTYILFDDSDFVINGFVERMAEKNIAVLPEQRRELVLAYKQYVEALGALYVEYSFPRQTNLVVVDAAEMNEMRRQKILSFAAANQGDCTVISMDPICDYPGALTLGVSRLYDTDGKSTGTVTHRPGHQPITDQVLFIQAQLGDNGRVVLSDDVVYTGGTIENTRKLLSGETTNGRSAVISDVTVFPGIHTVNLGPDGQVLDNAYDAVLRIEIPYGVDAGSVLDIGSGRDFLPGLDGVVTNVGRLPYINPMLSPCDRATVPRDLELDFSRGVVDISENFYTKAGLITGFEWTTEICEPSAVSGLAYFGFADSIDPSDTPTPMLTVLDRTRFAIDNLEIASLGLVDTAHAEGMGLGLVLAAKPRATVNN